MGKRQSLIGAVLDFVFVHVLTLTGILLMLTGDRYFGFAVVIADLFLAKAEQAVEALDVLADAADDLADLAYDLD